MPVINEREVLCCAILGYRVDLRASVDGWDFKQYILGIMLYRHILEHLEKHSKKNNAFGIGVIMRI